jgi:hypothetical protein
MMIAIAKAVSAAATAIIKTAKKTPCKTSGNKYLLMITKFTTDAFNTNSTEIKIEIKLVRVINPYTPIKNSIDVKVSISYMLTPSIMFFSFQFSVFAPLSSPSFGGVGVAFVPLAITIAPIIAASNKILITSKGNIKPPAS